MRVAVRARVSAEAEASPQADHARPRMPVQAVETQPEQAPPEATTEPVAQPFSLERTPIEAPRPELTLLPGGSAEPVEEPEAPATEPEPLDAAQEAEPAQPVPDRVASEMALGRSLAHVSVRSGPSASQALDELGAEGAARQGEVLVAPTPEQPEGEAREVMAHELAHAADTAPATPGGAQEAEAAAGSVGEALAAAVSDFHAPVEPGQRPLPEVDAAEVARAAPPEGEAGLLQRSATQRPPTPEPPPTGGDPGTAGEGRRSSTAPPPGGSSGEQDEAAEAEPEQRQPASERTGTGGGLGAPPPEAEADGELTDLPPVVGSTEVDVPAPLPPPLVGDDVDGMTSAFVSASPASKAFNYDTLGESLDSEAQEAASTMNEALPDLQQKMGGEGEMGEVAPLEAGEAEAGELGEVDEPLPDAEEAVPETPENEEFEGNDGLFGWLSGLFGGSSAQNAESIDEAIENIETVDESVDTSPGDPPPVPLEGATDPALIDEQRDEGLGNAATGQSEARTAVLEGPGPEAVQPLEMDEPVEVPEIEQQAMEQPAGAQGVELYKQVAPPADVQAAFDEQNAAEMEANLGEAKTQAEEATAQRDADWDQAVADAQEDNQELVDTAQRDQEAAVEEQRGRIQEERQSTLDQQQAEVDRVEEEAGELEEEEKREIDERVEADEAQIETEYEQAEEDAEVEVEKGEEDAEQEKEDAEEEAENQSWWDKIASWISDAIGALVDAVTAIIDLVADAINAILDAVRDLVVGLIELAADFIKSAIKAFGEALKGLVDGLLGEIFPELAAALTEAIDSAVEAACEAVDTVAQAMIDGVNAVLDIVQGALNAVLDVFKGAIALVGAVISAAITGDWGEVARLIIEGALSVAGISPEEFYGFIGQVQETFDTIVNDPMGFLGNIFGAIAIGFDQFVTNILDHLQQGFFEWLVGPLGEMGITLPETWDIWGILGLVLQVLGLTREGIRGVIVEELGETAGTVFDYVWRYVDALITGGWQGLWEEIQGDLSDLWQMVVDGIKDWLIEKIITEATLKLLSLLDPTGISAIVQVVLTAWRIYSFVKDNLQRIQEILTTVVGAIHDIAMGVLQPAGDAIEGVLGRLVPVAISLLANLFGIGGITNKVRDVIEGLRTRVRNALRNLIRKVKGLFGGGEAGDVDGEGAQDQGGLSEHERFSAGEESHELWVQFAGSDATVMMASRNRSPLDEKFAGWTERATNKRDDDEDTKGRKREARTAIGRARTLAQQLDRAAGRSLSDDRVSEAEVTEVDQLRNSLVAEITIILNRLGEEGSPDADVRFDEFARSPGIAAVRQDNPVFQTTDDPPQPVRSSSARSFSKREYAEFHQSRVPGTSADQAASWAQQDLTTQRQTRFVSKVGAANSSSYALVRPWVEVVTELPRGLDERIARVTKDNIDTFMYDAATGGSSFGVSASELLSLWGSGTSATPERDHLRQAFYDRDPGNHEWIPRSQIARTIHRVSTLNDAEEAAKIIRFYDVARSPTWHLVWKPDQYSSQSEEIDGLTLKTMNGHSGALKAVGPRGTELGRNAYENGGGSFHSTLGNAINSAPVSLTGIRAAIDGVLSSWIWDGSGKATYKVRGQVRTGAEYHAMKFKNGSSWEDYGARDQGHHHREVGRELDEAQTTAERGMP